MQVPIENPIGNPTLPITNPYPNPITNPNAAPVDGAFGLFVALGIGLVILTLYFAWRWMNKQEKITLDEVNPSLDDLDSGGFSLNTYLAIQGGMGVMISVICTLSLIFVFVDPLMTLTTCGAVIGLTGFVREKAMNQHRERYKDKVNLSGEMRDKMGTKRKYDWSNCDWGTPYTPHEEMYEKLKAHMKGQIAVGKTKEPGPKVKEKLMAEESKHTKSIRESINLENPEIEATPITINDGYLVILITKGEIDSALEMVKTVDYDIFGDYITPGAGPHLREITRLHRVKTDPNDPVFRVDEYIPVFVSIFDDRMSREAVRIIDSVDMETNDVIHGALKAMGVERKHTSGEINTAVAQSLDLLNDSRDWDLITSADGDRKADIAVRAKEKITAVDRILDIMNPNLVMLIIMLIVGVIMGFMWGQNSVLIDEATAFEPVFDTIKIIHSSMTQTPQVVG